MDASNLDQLPNIGKGIKRRVQEFLDEGKIEEFSVDVSETEASEVEEEGSSISESDFKDEEMIRVVQELEQVMGIGPKTAKTLYKHHGIHSIEDLKQN